MVNTINLAKNWLLNSGIQNTSINNKTNGGFNSWFDIKSKEYPFIYSEITGYGISTLLYLNKIYREKKLVERAELAARWLINFSLHESGGVRTRYYFDNKIQKEYFFKNGFLYTFDSGMVLYGLVNLFKQTKKQIYLKVAEKMADFLIRCQKKDGTFYAAYDFKNDEFIDTQDKWSTQSGSFHSKLSLGLLDIFSIIKDNSYKRSAEKICEAVLKFQDKSGRFVSFKKFPETHLHPHCYSAEGLLYAGIKLNKKKFIKSAANACEWTLNNQLKNGGVPCMFLNNLFIPYERSDILAQTLRLGAILFHLGELRGSLISNKLDKLENRLVTFQNLDNVVKKQKGGFFYGWDENGNRLNHLNSWCTMFAIQAIIIHKIISKENKEIPIAPFV